MTNFKKAIPRRSLLRGVGAALALPLLDGMVPAFASPAEVAAKSPLRLGFVYAPNGMWPMDQWTPKTEGVSFELSTTLKPLAAFRDRITVLTGLAQKVAEGGSDHAYAFATFLTSVHPQGMGQLGISVDQIAAQHIGKSTPLSSLEVALFPSDLVGKCEGGLGCSFVNTLCWRAPTSPLPMEKRPRAVFERLFGDSDTTDSAERIKQIRQKSSILDSVLTEVSSFMKELGAGDRSK